MKVWLPAQILRGKTRAVRFAQQGMSLFGARELRKSLKVLSSNQFLKEYGEGKI